MLPVILFEYTEPGTSVLTASAIDGGVAITLEAFRKKRRTRFQAIRLSRDQAAMLQRHLTAHLYGQWVAE